MTTLRTKAALTTLAAFSLAGTLAGCATATTGSGSSDTSSSDTSSSSSSSAATSGSYTDGTYTASATYQSPGGSEDIDVSLTIADGTVTAVKTTTSGTSPDEVHYQGEFNDNIASVVVGKKLDELNVDKVAGSSLTSAGFNDAVTKIKSEATA
jgi:uncharacterized protein with FMN-binding domain